MNKNLLAESLQQERSLLQQYIKEKQNELDDFEMVFSMGKLHMLDNIIAMIVAYNDVQMH